MPPGLSLQAQDLRLHGIALFFIGDVLRNRAKLHHILFRQDIYGPRLINYRRRTSAARRIIRNGYVLCDRTICGLDWLKTN